MIRENTIIFVF